MNPEACVIRLEDGKGQTWGTGFVVGPKLAVTCAHVVEACESTPGERVRWDTGRLQRREVVKFVINGKPVLRNGQTYDYKVMLTEYVRRHATSDDLMSLVELIKKARKCMGFKN